MIASRFKLQFGRQKHSILGHDLELPTQPYMLSLAKGLLRCTCHRYLEPSFANNTVCRLTPSSATSSFQSPWYGPQTCQRHRWSLLCALCCGPGRADEPPLPSACAGLQTAGSCSFTCSSQSFMAWPCRGLLPLEPQAKLQRWWK